MFANRSDAGRRLAPEVARLGEEAPVVVGLPRGGVPVAFEVARALHAPLDVILVRKVGVPYQHELAMGAIGEDGVRVVNDHVMRAAQVTPDEFDAVERRERVELDRRAERYRGAEAPVSLQGRTVVIVDDGIATGSTARAACQVARAHGARRVVLAVPVASASSLHELARVTDDIVCLQTPDPFYAVGQFYRDFSPTTEDEVLDLLRKGRDLVAPPGAAGAASADDPPQRDEEVWVPVDGVEVAGHLFVPEVPRGLVVFAHGSGSSRHSSRNRAVAGVLNDAGFGTLLFDLLTPVEEGDRANVFDIELLARRLTGVTWWLQEQPEARGSSIGYFGASTGAGAALWAASQPGSPVAAVVSRGGRPDLASPRLGHVVAPTLLIVGGNDRVVLELNRQAQAELRCENDLAVVPGATHLFEEPGTLAAVAQLATRWFLDHLAPVTTADA